MPSSPSNHIHGSFSTSQLQKFIPRTWKAGSIKSTTDVPMIDSLITSLKHFLTHGQLSKAFKTFSHIKQHSTNTSSSSSSSSSYDLLLRPISALLFSCTKLEFLFQGKQLHSHIISLGLENHSDLVRKLVTFYASFKLFDEAHIVVDNSNSLHPFPWNILVSSCVSNELYVEALSAYKNMLSKGIRPDNYTYPSVLKACGEKGDLGFGIEVHNSIDSCPGEWNLFVRNSLVSMYGKLGEVEIARKLFDKMPERDPVSWNAMISGYSSRGMWKEAIELFERMQVEGIEVNIITWNTIAGGCVRIGNFTGAAKLLSQMRTYGIVLDSVAINTGLGACSHMGDIKLGKEIHASAIRCFYDKSENVQNSLITMYARCKDLRRAYSLFQSMDKKSTITWNSMLSGYTHMDRAEEASFLFREMLLSGIKPNHVTIASILPLCARVANLQHGREFHCYITKCEGLKDHLLLWNGLVDMYARSGKVLEARKVFDSLRRRDEVTYTSLIAGYGMQGEGQKALKIFEEMIRLCIEPDHITMIAVLSACSHSGLVTQGQSIFSKMQTSYMMSPRLEHYACMADLFGRAGLLNKAREIIRTMPYRPTAAMWATLIGACRIHGNTEIGEFAAEKLLEMRPQHSGYYVLVANMYAGSGLWNKLVKVRTLMRDLGVSKAPGCSWVDVGSGFVSFAVGDVSNPNAEGIYFLLDGLSELMKDARDVATDDLEMDEW